MINKITFIILAAAFLLPLGAADVPAAYAEGVAACETGHFDLCAKKITAAAAQSPRSSLERNYIPFFYLGLAAYNQGEAAKAAACFEREASFGVVGKTAQGQTFNSLRKVLADRTAAPNEKSALGICAPPAPKPVTDTQFPTPPIAPVRPPAATNKNLEWSDHYDIGRRACDGGRWEECAKAMETATAIRPGSAAGMNRPGAGALVYTPWYYHGLASFNLRQIERAAQSLKKEADFGIIQKTPNAAAFLTLRGAIGESHPPVILPEITEISTPTAPLQPGSAAPAPRPAPPVNVTSADAKSAQADYVQGVSLLLTEKFQEAAASFESALKKDPRPHKWTRDYGMWFEPYIPHYYLAICYYQLGKLDDARHHIRISQAQELRGRLADQGGKLLDLSESIDQKEKPNDAATLYTMTEGIMRMLKGDYDRAARVFEFLITTSPRWAEAHLYLGISYFALSERYQESGKPGDAARAEEMRVLARKEFKFARKYDRKLTLSKIMLSPGLTDFWNKSVE